MKLLRNAQIWALACVLAYPLVVLSAPDPLDDLSLEELTKTEISSVSRRSQSLANVPAAAFVISAEDIRRSGAYALPDVLRMVPGIEVAQVDNGRYAVSARGFNGRFANKLQVLVDGRSIYSPFFSGVMWEHDPVALDDIERIEVIRGPSAAMWGANAVNGVINIITKHSAAQEGGLIAPSIGSNGFGQLYGRYGKRVDDNTSWRLSFQGRRIDPSTQYANQSEAEDKLKNAQLNFRFDRNLGSGSNLTLWASALQMKLGDIALVDPLPTLDLGTKTLRQTDDSQTLAARYRWLTGGVESSLQVSATRTHIEMENWFHEDRQTYDLDYQGRLSTGAHDLLWGLTHRTNSDEALSQTDALDILRQSFTQRTTGLFIHDEWTLIPERLQMGLGARWEHTNLGGATFAPSASLMWTPSRTQAAWVKLAQAPRVPARGENHVAAMTTYIPANPALLIPPILIRSMPIDTPLKPEKMASLELGYRTQLSAGFSANVVAYRQRYTDRISGTSGLASFPFWPLPLVVQDIHPCNCSGGWIDGVELAADWLVTSSWRLQLSLTSTRLDLNEAKTPEAAADNQTIERGTPKHYGSLRSQWNITANQQLDAWLRGSAGYERLNAPYTDMIKVPGYVTLDLRYAYRINKDLELSVTGRNLIGARRYEFITDYVPSVPVEIKPSLMLGLRLGF